MRKSIINNTKKSYYTLRPVFQPNNIIYAPTDNQKIFIRHLISKKEANTNKKKLTFSDEKLWKCAEKLLFEELAVAFEIPIDDVEKTLFRQEANTLSSFK